MKNIKQKNRIKWKSKLNINFYKYGKKCALIKNQFDIITDIQIQFCHTHTHMYIKITGEISNSVI